MWDVAYKTEIPSLVPLKLNEPNFRTGAQRTSGNTPAPFNVAEINSLPLCLSRICNTTFFKTKYHNSKTKTKHISSSWVVNINCKGGINKKQRFHVASCEMECTAQRLVESDAILSCKKGILSLTCVFPDLLLNGRANKGEVFKRVYHENPRRICMYEMF